MLPVFVFDFILTLLQTSSSSFLYGGSDFASARRLLN